MWSGIPVVLTFFGFYDRNEIMQSPNDKASTDANANFSCSGLGMYEDLGFLTGVMAGSIL